MAHPAAVIKFNWTPAGPLLTVVTKPLSMPARMFLAVKLAARGTVTITTTKIIRDYVVAWSYKQHFSYRKGRNGPEHSEVK
ncbi:hypothetical protein YC2023_064873 [Brassica napus]